MTKCVWTDDEWTPVRDLERVTAVYIDGELTEADDLDEYDCETCDDCGLYVPSDELTQRGDGEYCEGCIGKHPEEEEEDEEAYESPFVD